MNDEKKIINSYPNNRKTPFSKKKSYTTKDNSFSITTSLDDEITCNLVGVQKVSKDEAINKMIGVLEEKLEISKGGMNLFRYIYLNAKYQKDNILPIKIDYKESMIDMGYSSFQSVYNALLELLDKNIIARTGVEKIYYINPTFFAPVERILITEYYQFEPIKEETEND